MLNVWMFWRRGSVLAAQRVQSQNTQKDYEHELKTHRNLSGEAQGSSFWRLFFPEQHQNSQQQDCCEQRWSCLSTGGEDLFSRGQVQL